MFHDIIKPIPSNAVGSSGHRHLPNEEFYSVKSPETINIARNTHFLMTYLRVFWGFTTTINFALLYIKVYECIIKKVKLIQQG